MPPPPSRPPPHLVAGPAWRRHSLLLVLIASFAAAGSVSPPLSRTDRLSPGRRQDLPPGAHAVGRAAAFWGGRAPASGITRGTARALWLGAILGGVQSGCCSRRGRQADYPVVDYFYPLAFSTVYALLLICVWAYIRLRRARPRGGRALLIAGADAGGAGRPPRPAGTGAAGGTVGDARPANARDTDHRLLAEGGCWAM